MAVAAPATAAPAASYRVLVAAESQDEVSLLEFTPCAGEVGQCVLKVVRTYQVGLYPTDIEGPHGVVPSHDGKAFYVTLAHGRPNGFLQKFDMESGRVVDQLELGMFPATVDISPLGEMLYVINFNFEDPEMRPSSLSVVQGGLMRELARPTTCRMPHGSRLDPTGTRHYSGCMMNDLLVEVDATGFGVTRLFNLAPGKEAAVPAAAIASAAAAGTQSMSAMSHGEHTTLAPSSSCSPTWAQPSADGSKVYVACNKSNDIAEVDVKSWTMTRRWKTPAAPYNLAVTPDGRLLVATQKGPATTTIWNLADAKLLAEVPGTRKVASGVAVSRDSRYAFVTLEGIGGEPGTVDVIDLVTLKKVATADVGRQAGGVAVMP